MIYAPDDENQHQGYHSMLLSACEEYRAKLDKLERENAELKKDKERLDSGTILLIVHGERVHHVGVNLRDAIDAARKAVQP